MNRRERFWKQFPRVRVYILRHDFLVGNIVAAILALFVAIVVATYRGKPDEIVVGFFVAMLALVCLPPFITAFPFFADAVDRFGMANSNYLPDWRPSE